MPRNRPSSSCRAFRGTAAAYPLRRALEHWLEFQELYRKWQWAEREQLVIDQRWLDCFTEYRGDALERELREILATTAWTRRQIYDIRLRLVQHHMFRHLARFRQPGDLISVC